MIFLPLMPPIFLRTVVEGSQVSFIIVTIVEGNKLKEFY